MKPLLVALLLCAAVLAGCASTSSPSTSSNEPALAHPYQFDCSLSNWADPCTARASPNDSPSKAEVDIAVNPKDPLNVFVASKDLDRKASDCVWAVGQVTKDGGKTWKTTYVGGLAAERPQTSIFYGWHCITDPILTFNKDGDLFYALQMYHYDPVGLPSVPDPTGTGLVGVPAGGYQLLTVSHDGGESFSETYLMHAGDSGGVLFDDYMRIAANPMTGTVYTIWNQLTATAAPVGQSIPILVAYKPGSAAVQPPVYFPNVGSAASSQDVNALSLGESAVVADTTGKVYAWLGGFNSPNVVYFATSTDDGATFSLLQKAFDFTPMGALENSSYRYGTSVELAVDNSAGPHDGCLYAAWGGREAGVVGPSDIYTRHSCDGGATWSAPLLVNEAQRADGQWMARVSVDGLGTVHILYATRAYDPGHTLVDLEHAYSLDGGLTWRTERVTGISYDGDKGIHQNGFPFLGDYIGIASAGDRTYMGFPECIEAACEIGVALSVHTPHNEGVEEHHHG